MLADSDDDRELLTEFERDNLRGRYRQHLINTRNNWGVNFNEFRPLWNCFMLINEIWNRELEDLSEGINDRKEVFPFFLFVAAHAKALVVINLLFSDHVTEAYSIMRDVIEFVVHGYRLLSHPDLLEVWCNRGNDSSSLERWKEEFWFAKERRLFEGLPELYFAWKLCSERGSHAHVSSLLDRYYAVEPNTEWALHDSGVAPELLPLMLFGILQIMSNLECRIFEITESYLRHDTELQQMRDKFSEDKQSTIRFMKLDLTMDASASGVESAQNQH
jgi:hypothetical protein